MPRYTETDEVREGKLTLLSESFGRFAKHVTVSPDDVMEPGSEIPETEELQCERCLGAGFLRRDVAVDHPDFGKPVPCSCPLGQRARLRAMERIWESAGVPKEFSAYTLESWLRRNKGKTELVEALVAWEETQRWAVLTGPVGVGKSALAAIMAHRALKRGLTARFVVAPDVLDRVYAAMDRGRGEDEPSPWDVLKSLTEPDLLVLDDLVVGNRVMKDDGQERFFRLIDQRKRDEKRTIITSNVPMEAADRDPMKPRQKLMSECLWEQTFDRIRGRSQKFNLTGISQRSLDDVTPSADELEELPWA